MDEEVKLIVDEAYARTIKLMEDKKDQVILIAELLLAKETITNNDVAELIGKRPFKQSEVSDMLQPAHPTMTPAETSAKFTRSSYFMIKHHPPVVALTSRNPAAILPPM